MQSRLYQHHTEADLRFEIERHTKILFESDDPFARQASAQRIRSFTREAEFRISRDETLPGPLHRDP